MPVANLNDKKWKDLHAGEQVVRTRLVVKGLMQKVDKMEKLLLRMTEHIHDEKTGNVIQIKHLSPRSGYPYSVEVPLPDTDDTFF